MGDTTITLPTQATGSWFFSATLATRILRILGQTVLGRICEPYQIDRSDWRIRGAGLDGLRPFGDRLEKVVKRLGAVDSVESQRI